VTPPDTDRPVALVTGARRGIGRYLAEHLLACGYLVVGCSRNPQDWEAERYSHLEIDVANEGQVNELFRHVARTHGRLDVVLNNAAVASMNHVLLTPLSTVEKTMSVNVAGTFLVSREAIKMMRKRRYGRIVNFSSAVAPMRLAGEAVYVASKCAVTALSQVTAREVAEFGITVNVVAPAPTDTDMIRGVPKAKMETLLGGLPLKRLSTVQDIANVVDFFLRPESSAVTGQVINLCGVPNG
jgi:3-oxoacyl-[acyl-carrier protein] reductase